MSEPSLAHTPPNQVGKTRQNNRASQGHQHGGHIDHTGHRTDFENQTKQKSGCKGAVDGQEDVDPQVGAIIHEFRDAPADSSCRDQINENMKVHIMLQARFELSHSGHDLIGCVLACVAVFFL
jgi:hypothetical protein